MSALDQIYSRGTVLQIAGPEAEAFKAWRNRLGLFPETQKSEGWNKYSFVDIVTLAIVHELTGRGITAQVAVAIGMAARPLLTDSMNAKISAELRGQTDALASAVLDRMTQRKSHELHVYLPRLATVGPNPGSPDCAIVPALSPIVFQHDRTTFIAIDLFSLVFDLFTLMHLHGTETEHADGTRHVEPSKIQEYFEKRRKDKIAPSRSKENSSPKVRKSR